MVPAPRPTLRSTGGRFTTSFPAGTSAPETAQDIKPSRPETLTNDIPFRGPPPTHSPQEDAQETHLTRRRATKPNGVSLPTDKIYSQTSTLVAPSSLQPLSAHSTDSHQTIPIKINNAASTATRSTRSNIASQTSLSASERLSAASPAPSSGEKKEDVRRLRSKDVGPRFKSDLSKFFPDYEDVMNDVPEPQDFVGINEPILITNVPLKGATASTSTPVQPRDSQDPPVAPQSNGHTAPPTLTPRRIDISAIQTYTSDPLSDEYYFKAHRKKEMAEKRVRSIEKETALHEKAQLERLLEELKGPDWLKALGVSSASDAERKNFETKRAYFTKESRNLLEKFRRWKEEEKRLKLEKERALAAEMEEDESDEEDESEDGDDSSLHSSDVDACVTKQLLEEANRASRKHRKKTYSNKNVRLRINPPKELAETPESSDDDAIYGAEFVLDIKIPHLKKRDFSLPSAWITEEAIRSNARKRRKLNRDLQQARREEEEKRAKLGPVQ